MKREIKFRGLRVDGKGWVYGLPEYCPKTKTIRSFTEIIENGSVGGVRIIPESVGQFTGLKDKNGVDIYEGDIMEYGNYSFSVTYNPHYGFVAQFNHNQNVIIPIYKFVVIGNIHENPELLS